VSAEAILDPAAFKTKSSKRSCCLPLINVSSSLPGPDLLSESFASRRKRLRREGRRKSFPRWEEEEGEKRSCDGNAVVLVPGIRLLADLLIGLGPTD